MATAKKPVRRSPATKTPAKKNTSTAIQPFNGMVEEVEETAVSKNALSVYSDKPLLDGTDLFIPRLRLAQGLTQEVQNGEAKPGQWLILGTEPAAEVTVVPVLMTRRRELRDPDTRTTVCRSGDAITGVGNPGGDCATCPMSMWVKSTKKGGKNSAPPCSFLYSYMVYIVEAKTMAILEFSRTSILTGKMLNTMIMQKGIGAFAVRLGAVSKQGPKGTFYSPTISATNVKVEELKRALAEAEAVK
jgi:hypothetical protein